MPLEVPSNASTNQFYLIAVARGVDANSIATTTMSWLSGSSAANTIPMVARVFRRTGTLSLMVGSLRLNSTIIQPLSAASSALLGAGSDPTQFQLDTTTSTTAMPVTGNWDINITTFNGTASTVDAEIWGFRTS